MLKMLFEVARQSIAIPEGTVPSQDAQRHLWIVEHQIHLANRALVTLKSLRIDIEALRVDGGTKFEGTSDCDYGDDDVTLDWPNLALMSDELETLLADIESSERLQVWYVFHGDCQQAFRCVADDREQAHEQCEDAYPGETVHAAVPADPFGTLVMEGYGEDPVSCPKCGSRTEFGDLPRDGWQLHVCQRSNCQHSFIAVPGEEEETA